MIYSMEFPNSNYKIGLCFKTYVHEGTTNERYNIIKQFLDSLKLLLNNHNNLIIVGIIDCALTNQLDKILKEIDQLIIIIVLNENRGISFATNIGIEYLLDYNCDYIFCSDDDIIIKNGDTLNLYVNAMINYKFRHLVYYPSLSYPQYKSEKINDDIVKFNDLAGCFYCFTKNCIYEYGYLPILDGKYGGEHHNLRNILGSAYDLINSNQYITLNDRSIRFKSGQDDINTMKDGFLNTFQHSNFWKELVKNKYCYKY